MHSLVSWRFSTCCSLCPGHPHLCPRPPKRLFLNLIFGVPYSMDPLRQTTDMLTRNHLCTPGLDNEHRVPCVSTQMSDGQMSQLARH